VKQQLYVVFCTDKLLMQAIRNEVRPIHRMYLRMHAHSVDVMLGGPTFDERFENMNGTLLVIKADSISAVRNFIAEDPYTKAGLFSEISVRPWVAGIVKDIVL
jgi:uncharacterized protein YciI